MRLDCYLTEKGYAESRERAKRMIESGGVILDGIRVIKPSCPVSESEEHRLEVSDPLRYVSRGGLKLEGALAAFSVDPRGMVAIDIGASTGGFTDCLLQNGAKKVFAVDSGTAQLSGNLLADPRVISMEKCNARGLNASAIGEFADLIVMDVSFISSTYLIPIFRELLKDDGIAISLIKPQFEVGRSQIGKKGIVKDPKAHRFAIEKVIACGLENHLSSRALIRSPIFGGDGNAEFLILFEKSEHPENWIGEDRIQVVVSGKS